LGVHPRDPMPDRIRPKVYVSRRGKSTSGLSHECDELESPVATLGWMSHLTEIRVHLAGLPDDRRADVVALDEAIRETVPELPVKLWQQKLWGGTDQSIIGYGEITAPRSKGKAATWYLIGVALQKDHISLYLNAVEDGVYLAEARKGDLGKVKVGKSAITFRKLDDVNLEVALDLVRRAALQADPS
jgi:hypothetical protein